MYQGLSYEIAAVMPQARDTGLFVSLCTIQQPSGVFGPSGAPDGLWVDVTGLVEIPCTAPPISEARLQSTEVKALAEIMSRNILHVLLNGFYAPVSPAWRAVIDGTAYDILGTEHDSQSQMTRMEVQLAQI